MCDNNFFLKKKQKHLVMSKKSSNFARFFVYSRVKWAYENDEKEGIVWANYLEIN